VSKLDLLIDLVRGLIDSNARIMEKMSATERRLDGHDRDVSEFRKKMRKTAFEPHWLLRAVAIAALGGVTAAAVNFILKGGLAAGVP
jgi:hypothetical protein